MKLRRKYVVPALYFLGGIGIWISFLHAPPDGLANVGVALYVFPITFASRALGFDFPPFVPKSLHYYEAHTAFFLPSLALLTLVLYAVLAFFERRS